VNFKKYLEEAVRDFPKHKVEHRITPSHTPYKWFFYDFDEISDWYARWLQNYAPPTDDSRRAEHG